MHAYKTAFCLASGLALSLLSTATLAQNEYNRVSLRAEASVEVAHDLMQVVLYTEARDEDAARLAETITRTLNQAIDASKKVSQVQVALGSRQSQPVRQDKSEKIIAWRERAELRLESTDFASLSKLTGQLLQQQLGMSSMRFNIANATRLEHENRLLEQAITAFGERASLASKALGGKDYKLVSLHLNAEGGYQPPMYRQAVMMSAPMADSSTAPTIEAGQSQLKMVADGVIEVMH